MKDFEIDMSLDELKMKSTDSFRRIVKIKTKEFTMNYLLQLKDGHTKMDNLNYGELGLQSYLKDSRIPVAEARNLYRYRTRCVKYKENMKSSYTHTSLACPLCLVQPDTQKHSLESNEVKSKTVIEGKYEDIFDEDIPSGISKTLLRIAKLREELF